MIPNNNLNPLPFYDSIDKQNHRKSYAFGDIYAHVTTTARFLPFQINKEHDGVAVTAATLHNLETGQTYNVLYGMNTAGLSLKQFASDGYDLIIYPGQMIFPTFQMPLGIYYLELTDGTNTWYSEIFTVVKDVSDFMKIEYWDRDNMYYNGGHIDYADGYKNYVYVKTDIGKPEYPFEEEAQQRDGFIFIEKQISEKKYIFEFLAPEFLCDALRIVRMHDYINIYFRGETYNVENIIFEPKWREQGNLAVMEVEFECDTIIKKVGKGVASIAAGDFNNDFNNDFDNN